MKLTLLLSLILLSLSAKAEVSVLFHPYDPTLKTISKWISQAKESVDIAMYNIDADGKNPIVAKIKSRSIQKRLKSGRLQIRMIFEGFASKEKNAAKMQKLEDLGIDVKYLGSSKKMHHKFAVIDANGSNPRLITGSANWSMSSRRHFNENILFMQKEYDFTDQFNNEFVLLWKVSREFGNKHEYTDVIRHGARPSLKAKFNTSNFKVKNGRLVKDRSKKGYVLTRKIIKTIDEAQEHIQIATTRIKLRPIYDALLNAAARGVKIDIVVSMSEYTYKNSRKRKKLPSCSSAFEKNCSTSKNFSIFLSRDSFKGHENINLRVKYFNLQKTAAASLVKQMHSKYMIIDSNKVLTGSFNWSYSAEYNHIENIVTLEHSQYPSVLENFSHDFDRLWALNRDGYEPLIEKVEANLLKSRKMKCSFNPMTLSFEEVDYLLASGKRVGKKLKSVCK